MLLDSQRRHLDLACAPSVPRAAQQLLNGLVPGVGAGSCGTAVYQRRPVYVLDTQHDPRWEQLRHVATQLGLGACWSFPIFADGNTVLGTVAISSFQPRQPSPFHVKLLDSAAHLAGIALSREAVQQTLATTRNHLQLITDSLPGVVFQLRLSDRAPAGFAFVSGAIQPLLGIAPEALVADAAELWRRIPEEDLTALQHSLTQAHAQRSGWEQTFRCRRGDGALRWLKAAAQPGNGQDWNGLLLDISEDKARQDELKLAGIAFAATNEGILVTDAHNAIIDVNRALCHISGYEREELLGQTPALFNSGRHDAHFYNQLWQSLQSCGHWQGELWSRRKNGEVYPQWININAVYDEDNKLTHYVSVAADTSLLRESEQKLTRLSLHDSLTDLPNRSLFKQHLERTLKNRPEGSKVAVLIMDMDRFKHINDCLGHAAGDQLLLQVAARLNANISAPDTVARIGGDEFAVLVRSVAHAPDAEQVAQHIVGMMEAPFELNGRHYFTTTSIGIALAPDHGSDSEALLKHADMALYQVKGSGRNNYALYQPELTASVEEWITLEPALRTALEQQQFELYYQPQMNMTGEHILGAEALLRWQHPELGRVSPARFLPIAEEIGLMPKLGAWVLEEACAQLARWRTEGLGDSFRLAVNLSSAQLNRNDLPGQVRRLLRKYRLPPAALELEILESFAMEYEQQTVRILQELADLGTSLALDDFGTGYSSLSYLKKLPVHKVKIDQSLVRDIPQDSNDEAIARAVIALSHSLNLRVCAEGVETEQQKALLAAEQCDQLQGYLFSRPVPAAEFHALLLRYGALAPA